MSRFNEQQKEVILHGETPLMVVSSAGGGKSTTIVARAVKKVKEGKKNICVITFTRNTADDLTKKFNKAGVSSYVSVGTFHSICGNILRKEGINISKRVKDYEIENLFKKIIQDDKKIDMKDIMSFISYQKNNMRSYKDDFVEKESGYGEDQLRDCFRVYEEYKDKIGAYDFDDYLILGHKILLENPHKYEFDWVFVDETQDSNKLQMEIVDLLCPSGRITVVGDYRQCLVEGTKIKTSNGEKNIEEISNDDEIIVGCGRGLTNKSKIKELMIRDYDGDIINIKTKSGKEIRCTPNHMIFMSSFINKPYYVYLMYKEGYGFRIGQSSMNESGKKKHNGFMNRLNREVGDKVWCIKTCETKNEVNYYELLYAFKYGIPLYMFNVEGCKEASLSREQVVNLFNDTNSYEKGMKLLKDMNMFFDYPHYTLQGNSKKMTVKSNLTMFGSSRYVKGHGVEYVGYNHEFNICTINESFVNNLKQSGLDVRISDRKNSKEFKYWEIRRTTHDHDKLYKIGEQCCDLIENSEFRVYAKISKECDKKELFPASNVREGMTLAIYENGELINDEVVEVLVEKYKGRVYDINVESYRNYIANDICVHNCMYSFRGSKPELFMDFYKSHPNTNVVNMNINYRSHKEIVEKSNDFIRQYYGDYEYYSDAVANSQEHAEIELMVNDLPEVEAQDVCDKVQTLLSLGYKGSDIAILFRNNVQSQHIENEFKVRDIDYFIESEGGFFNRKEIDIVMCMLRLIDNPEDDSAFEKLFRYRCEPFVFLANTILNDIISLSSERDISHLEASTLVHVQPWQSQKLRWFANTIEKLINQHNMGYSLLQIMNNIISTLDMENYIRTNYPNEEDQTERLESLENLKKFIRNNTLDTFLKFVYEKNTSSESKNSENKVQMMTIHKSKGLEFKAVFVVGIATGKFPSEKSDIQEEANVFYVAVTRAIERMYLSQIGTYNQFLEQYYGEEQYPIVVQDSMF